MEAKWDKVALIGLGLMGGSCALALKERGQVKHVAAVVRRPDAADEAVAKGLVDSASLSLRDGVTDADAVIVCTSIQTTAEFIKKALFYMKPGTFITDVASVKGPIVQEVEACIVKEGRHVLFVGSHPMAGSEKSGLSAARADLYEGASTIITPTEKTLEEAVIHARVLWEHMGSITYELTPGLHDKVAAMTSHMPHIAASAVVAALIDSVDSEILEEAISCIGTGFKDFTRIASSDPEMWRHICALNKHAVIRSLKLYQEQLDIFLECIRKEDWEKLTAYLARSKTFRDELP